METSKRGEKINNGRRTMKMTKRARFDQNILESKEFQSVNGSTFGGNVAEERSLGVTVGKRRRFAAIQNNAADLRRIGLALCFASSIMTVGSAVTLAVYLL